KESRETIWQLYPSNDFYDTYDGSYFVPASLTSRTLPAYIISDALLSYFELGDKRVDDWIGVKTIDTETYYFPNKYKRRSRSTSEPHQEYTIVFRLSELFLIHAEASMHLTGNNDAAIADLNAIRSRAGLTDLLPSEYNGDIFIEIENERFRELFCEWGHRW